MKAFFSKLVLGLAATAGLGIQQGLIPPKIAAYTGLGLTLINSFLPRVNQSASDVQVADSAIRANKIQ